LESSCRMSDSQIKRKKSVPVLRKFSIFTGLDEQTNNKDDFSYDNPAMYNESSRKNSFWK
jgi:hypothetical protein